MMAIEVAEISRLDLQDPSSRPVCITDVKHLASYNWIEASSSTIAIPGKHIFGLLQTARSS